MVNWDIKVRWVQGGLYWPTHPMARRQLGPSWDMGQGQDAQGVLDGHDDSFGPYRGSAT